MVTVSQLCKQFHSGRGRVQALRDISFQVPRGSAFVIQGRSGSGKTTLLHCLGGLERPDSGRIVCDDLELTALATGALSRFQRHRLGLVFQAGNLLSHLTVGENLALPLALTGLTAAQRQQRIAELLEAVGLPTLAPALPAELSGGERQRIAFARAIAHRPALLLADEPTASLDSATGQHLVELMFAQARQQQVTTIIVTHDPDLAHLADAGLTLSDGQGEIWT